MACRQRLLVLAVCYAMRTTFATPVLGEFTRECAERILTHSSGIEGGEEF